MSIKRTEAGLTNLALFEGVSSVVYVEGGNVDNVNSLDIQSGKHGIQSCDIVFWRALFEKFNPKLRVAFRCAGSKENLRQLAAQIEAGHVKNTIVAIDADYECLEGKSIKHSNILYTHAYCYENDIWHKSSVASFIQTAAMLGALPRDVIDDIMDTFDDVDLEIKRLAKLQYLYVINGIGFLPLKSLQAIVKTSPISLNKKQVCRHLKTAREKRDLTSFVRRIPKKFRHDIHFPGKVNKEIGYALIKKHLHRLSGQSLSKDLANTLLIMHCSSKVGMLLPTESRNHYRRKIKALK